MDEIFEVVKESKPEKEKKPRKLTDKQLENLAKGRAKMAEKRKLVKGESDTTKTEVDTKQQEKEVAKQEKEAIADMKAQRKEAKKEEKKQLKEIGKADEIISKNKIAHFKDTSMKFMEKCESPEQLKLLKKILARYTEDDIVNESKLKDKMTRDLKTIQDYIAKNKK